MSWVSDRLINMPRGNLLIGILNLLPHCTFFHSNIHFSRCRGSVNDLPLTSNTYSSYTNVLMICICHYTGSDQISGRNHVNVHKLHQNPSMPSRSPKNIVGMTLCVILDVLLSFVYVSYFIKFYS